MLNYKYMCIMAAICMPLLTYGKSNSENFPYYQSINEKTIVTANIGISGGAKVNDGNTTVQGSVAIPINVETYWRYTTPNIFGYNAVLLNIPFYNEYVGRNFHGAIFMGIGWYVFDHRDNDGLGWSQMMAFAGGFYPFNNNLGGGVRIVSRWNYSFNKQVAVVLGIDFDYAFIQFRNEMILSSFYSFSPEYHFFTLGFTLGFTFYVK